jgi:hypothetical protein
MKNDSLIYGLRSTSWITMIHLLRILMMTKNVVLTLFITFLSYAIVSSIGQPQHTYSGSNHPVVVN